MSESIVQVSRVKDGVQIYVSWESLYDLVERNPDNPLKVVDKEGFKEEFIWQLQNYAQSNDIEVGCSHLEWLIDECAQQVYESGSMVVKASNDNLGIN